MAINTSSIEKLLRPGLDLVFGDYPVWKSQWSEIFSVHNSDMAVEIDVEMKMLGMAEFRAEGAPTAMDNMGQRIITSYNSKYLSLGFQITRQAIKDNLYEKQFPLAAKALRRSLETTKNVLGASVLNNGFDINFPIGDGQPVFSTAHPIDGGTYANTFTTQADLNEASLESAIIGIQQFRDQAGLPVMTQAQKLIVPAQGQFVASRLLNSSFRTNTGNNDVSAIFTDSAIPESYRVNQFLTNPSAWFVLTDMNKDSGFKHFVREPIGTDMYTDMDTDTIKVKAVERYSFGCSNARAAWGSSGSA